MLPVSKGDRNRSISRKFKEKFETIKFETDYSDRPWNKKKQYSRKAHHIMPDIEPYQTVGPEQGKVIGSRSKEREYLKRHGLEQVGNEKDYFFRYNGKTPDNPTKDW